MDDNIRWVDISDDVEFKNGKANPWGWSTEEIHYQGKKIGSLYCGEPTDFKDGYRFELKNEGKRSDGKEVTRCIIFKKVPGDE